MEQTTEPIPQKDSLEAAVERRLLPANDDGSSFTIFRVPAHIREENRRLYEPRLVSIGPYYRGRDELRAMEQHKWRLLRHFLERAGAVPLSDFVRAVRGVEQRARCCYSERTAIFDGDGFAEMLLLDGCFILEFLFKWNRGEPDPLCDVGWGLTLLHSDILLLENQIPFFVLEHLFDTFFRGAVSQDKLIKILLMQLKLNGTVVPRQLPRPEVMAGHFDHLLHLLHENFVPKPVDLEMELPAGTNGLTSLSPPRLLIPCVSLLREAGVTFKKKMSPRDMFDITFDKNRGIMELPRIEIHLANLPQLINLIALEQSRGHRFGTPAPLTNYTALMSSLVRSGQDVSVLQRSDIIDNLLSNDDEAAINFFSRLGDPCTMHYSDNLFAQLFDDVKCYHDSRWHKHRAMFKRAHCNTPWSIIALVLAIITFFFTFFNNLPNNGPTYYYYCLSQQLLPHLVGVHGAAVRADHRDCYPRRPWLPSLAIVATARAICADPLYVHALDYFTGNNRVRDAITAKLVGYLARAEEIRQALVGDDVARVAAVAAPTAELKKDSKGNDGGGGGDSERANLRAGLHSAIVSGKPDVRWSDVFGLDGAKQVP
ncbi:UPF0481 protein At3g47200-like [Oryza brachyantha]|uniref:UPF0481 protein At3g47200-like n=1 Tax=Oryza brachyantha TaxID=4533 RepID=UPI001ADC9C75|nr:UPF0481 protein At3g47200-like [Oryza brachyantha]